VKLFSLISRKKIPAIILLIGVVLSSSINTVSVFATNPYSQDYYSGQDILFYNPDDTSCTSEGTAATTSLTGADNKQKIWNYYSGKQLTAIAIAGIMGNFSQESGFDPAVKQNQSTAALPDGGDGVTGYGIAQWTSKGRQAGVLAAIKAAGLAEYYGAGWGASEKDKSIPQADSDKLLLTELNYSWSGDSTPISGFASKLNAATTVDGNGGSTVIFHDTYEISADNASMIQQRITDADTFLAAYGGGASSGQSCSSSASLGGVSNLTEATAWAQKFISDTNAKYPSVKGSVPSAKLFPSTATRKYVYQYPQSGGYCWLGSNCGECTAASGWFVTNMTSYAYGGGNGNQVVGFLAAKGVPTGSKPEAFSIFSMQGPGSVHTGIVLGVLADGSIITLEDNYNGAGVVTVTQYASLAALIGSQRGGSIIFGYVGNKLKGAAAGLGGTS
jgi:hypothetical protein